MLFIAILVFVCLTLFDLPAIVKNRKWKELAVYSLTAAIAFIYLAQLSLGKQTFSPLEQVNLFVKNTLGLSYENWR